MYINSISIRNLKLLRDVEIPLTRGSEPRMWTVLVGENGLCKTSILQAIALAALGADSANAFPEIIPSLPDRRKPGNPVEIRAEFGFGTVRHTKRTYPGFDSLPAHPPRLISRVALAPGWTFFSGDSDYLGPAIDQVDGQAGREPDEKTNPVRQARGTGLPYWFVAGYGTVRSLPLPRSVEGIIAPTTDRLASLFDRGSIVGTGFADLLKTKKLVGEYVTVLQHALLDQKGILPAINRLELRGKGGVKSAKQLVESHRFDFVAGGEEVRLPATWLSHGYQATISWISDLVGQMFWEAQEKVSLDQMEGLVLIDELDLHLHPLWQVGLIRALKQTFPRVQFVATTHSPMLLPGLERDEIWHARLEGGNVQVEMFDQSPALMTGSELYQTFFGIDRLYPADLGEALYRYGYLASDPRRSDEANTEMQRLHKHLVESGVEPGLVPVSREDERE
ncbi:MAG: AAA family ATPase [Isosphaerales bacterium]